MARFVTGRKILLLCLFTFAIVFLPKSEMGDT